MNPMHRRSERKRKTPGNRRSRLSLNDCPSFCAHLYTSGGVGELYMRQSTFFSIVTLCRLLPHQD